MLEKYSRGRRGAPAKGVGRVTGARVQIPLSPLVSNDCLEQNVSDSFLWARVQSIYSKWLIVKRPNIVSERKLKNFEKSVDNEEKT